MIKHDIEEENLSNMYLPMALMRQEKEKIRCHDRGPRYSQGNLAGNDEIFKTGRGYFSYSGNEKRFLLRFSYLSSCYSSLKKDHS